MPTRSRTISMALIDHMTWTVRHLASSYFFTDMTPRTSTQPMNVVHSSPDIFSKHTQCHSFKHEI
jgi:hypothetical protein